MNDKVLTIVVLLASYLAGSVNFSLLVFRMLKRDDPRNHFSGNVGVTNVYRQAGFFWATVILLLDVGRALALSLAALHLLPIIAVPWPGLALVAGNCFPCFHGFRGGKGVASYLGFTLPLSPPAALIAAILWVGVYEGSRIPFVASFFMLAALAGGTIAACGYHLLPTGATLATVLLIGYRHRQNISDCLRRVAD